MKTEQKMPRSKTKLYDHSFCVMFSVLSGTEDASDVTPQMILSAILKKADMLLAEPDTVLDSVGLPDSSVEVRADRAAELAAIQASADVLARAYYPD